MGISDIWELSRQGMQANRQAMQTTSNNISNANSPGYTRQKAVITSRADPVAGVTTGGVEVKGVIRIHDKFVQKQILDEAHGLGNYKARSEALSRVENLVAKEGEQLGELMTQFFNNMRELSANPETSTVRDVVGSSAEALTNGFHRTSDALDGMRRDLDLRIENSVEQVNTLAKELAGINQAIMRAEARAEIPNELYDRKDMILREMGEKIDFQATEDQFGATNIVAGGHPLVQGTEFGQLFTMRTPADGDKAEGGVDIYVRMPNGSGRIASKTIGTGEIGGMIHVRDQVINKTLNDLDTLAYQFTNSVNEVHKQGVGMDGQGGRGMFADLGETSQGASRRFNLDEAVGKNRELIAAASVPNAPGDNEIALAISDLQNLKLQPSELGVTEHKTFHESLTGMVGKIGVETQRENNFYRHQQAVVEQLDNYRESVSGVSLEEEAINLMQYQTVFNASAKAYKIGEELMDTILSLKR